ncbi:hypothetical protein KR009_010993, partial [Drosophila setifemur]
ETDLMSWRSVFESVDSFLVIMPTLLGFILSRLLCGHLPLLSTRRFLLEFLLIAFPTVILCTVGSAYTYHYSLMVSLAILMYLFVKPKPAAKVHMYEVGKRPIVFSLLRSTAYCGTCAAILAVDFSFYPTTYRKSRYFGAAAMDMGIGLFVVTMGLVSHRARSLSDLKKMPRLVLPVLVLGLARTIVITLIDYHQDESEYGRHLNAFFILGFTKLLGGLFSLLAKSDEQLLALALGILFFHEMVLQMGLLAFVMSPVRQEGFIRDNAEGLSSLLGCVALYLLSIYFAKWYTRQDQLSHHQLITKLKNMLAVASTSWLLVFASAHVTGIARISFNFGYVVWIFAVTISLVLIYAFIFELKLVNLNAQKLKSIGDMEEVKSTKAALPTFVESLNMNGLTHFLLSNLLTGLVNMSLDPDNRNAVECVVILSVYMFVSAGVVFILLRKRIRIA